VTLRRRCLSSFLLCLLFGGFDPPRAAAQAVTATIVGTVKDTSQAVIPGATVEATRVGTDVVRSTVTNDRGDFTVLSLQPGIYQVTAELSGFRRVVFEKVELNVNQTARLDFVLEVGVLEDTVQVEGRLATIESETSAVGQVIDSQQMRDLPAKGRSFFELALLAPGTSPASPGSFVADRRPTPGGLNAPSFYVGGAREKSNGYLIDGVDAQDPHYLTPSFFPSIDAIQEFKLQTSSYSAEFGRSASQVNVATRSGSNEWHGSSYWFHRDESMESRGLSQRLANTPKAPLDYNQVGGTLGGPVRLGRVYDGRSRTFFFVNYEGTRIDRGRVVPISVPTAAQRGGDFSAIGFRSNRLIFDPATTRPNPNGPGFVRDPFPNNTIPANRITPFAREVLAMYPQAMTDAAAGSNYFGSLVDVSDGNQVLMRVDHRLNDRLTLFGRYALFDGVETSGSPITLSGSGTEVRTHNFVANATKILGTASVLELRAGVNSPSYLILQDGAFGESISSDLGLRNLMTDSVAYGVPAVSATGFAGIGNSLNPTTQQSRVWHFVSHFSSVRGRHSLKTGADFRRIEYNDRSEREARGTLSFSGAMTADPQRSTTTGVSVADLLLGLPASAAGSSVSLAGNLSANDYGLFVQDDWLAHPNLTVNIGVRYEVHERFRDASDRLSLFDKDYAGGRVLIAGTETAYIPGQGVVSGPATPRDLLSTDMNNFAPRLGLAWRPFGNARTAVGAGYGHFFDLTELQDLRTWVRNPPFGAVVALTSDPNANSNDPSALRVADLFPAAGAPAARPNIFSPAKELPDPYYQRWNFNVQRELVGLTGIEVGYLGSRGHYLAKRVNLNQASRDVNPAQPTPLLSRRPFPVFGNTIRFTEPVGESSYHGGFIRVQRRYAQGYSYLGTYTFSKSIDNASVIDDQARDVNDRLLDRGRSSFDIRHRAVLSGTWDLPVGLDQRFLSSGPLAYVLGNWQMSGTLSLRSGFPFSVMANGDSCNCGAAGQTAQQIADADVASPSREQWFNTAAFINPASGTLGNSGRNILDGPGAATFNLALVKQILFGTARLQVRAEVFNLFNRDNLSQPGNTVGTPTFGIIQSTSDPRSAQLALKMLF
jgi:Carboxypeptidase regulatory-like domain/TonB dependent receptor